MSERQTGPFASDGAQWIVAETVVDVTALAGQLRSLKSSTIAEQKKWFSALYHEARFHAKGSKGISLAHMLFFLVNPMFITVSEAFEYVLSGH